MSELGTPSGTPSKGDRTRQQIENAAYTLFLEQGFHATSMRQIAHASNLAVGGIYNHFSNKDEIFRAILLERHPFQEVVPILLSTPADTPEAFIRSMGGAMVRELQRRPDVLKLMFIEIVEFNGQHVSALFESFLPQLQPLFQRFQTFGPHLREIPSLVMARAFIGLFFSYFITEFFMGRAMPAQMQQDAFDYFVDIYLHGVLAPTPASPPADRLDR
jgi:AcrR family transcriptional regulator